jgi:hypothetical protein
MISYTKKWPLKKELKLVKPKKIKVEKNVVHQKIEIVKPNVADVKRFANRFRRIR